MPSPLFNRHIWTRLFAWTTSRLALLVGISVLLAGLAFLRFCPATAYWEAFYEPFRIYRFWVLIVFGGLLLFTFWGQIVHRLFGRHFLIPATGLLLLVLLAGAFLFIACDWAVDWPAWYCWLVIALLAACLVLARYAAIACLEWWRMRSNGAVTDAVALHARMGRRARTRLLPVLVCGGEPWGSMHRLRVLQGCYDTRKSELLRADTPSPDSVTAYVNTALSLEDALRERYPADVLSEHDARSLRAHVLRELLTVTTWVSHRAPGLQCAAIINDCISRFEAAFVAGFVAAAGAAAFREILLTCFRIGSPQTPEDDVRRGIALILERFPAVRGNDSITGASRQAICAHTWLAVTCGLRESDRFDVWHNLRREQGAGPNVDADHPGECDPAKIIARRELAVVYHVMGDAAPSQWSNGLNGAARHAEEDARAPLPPETFWPDTLRASSGISSWSYAEAWHPRSVRWAFIPHFVVAGIVLFLALCAINPRLMPSFGTNSIVHVRDPRAGHNYMEGRKFSALAAAPNWLAVGTTKGLVLVNQHSHVPRDLATDRPVLDVAAAPSKDEFLILRGDQSIARVRPPSLPGAASKVTIWLDKASPLPLDASDIRIAASALDRDRWLVAITGHGLATYPFGSMPGGMPYRLRTWQMHPEFWDIDLQGAYPTRESVWVLTANAISCARRDTLEPIPGRRTAASLVARFETQYDDPWAAALCQDESVLIFPRNGEQWEGPFFTGRDYAGRKLDSIADVTVARETDNSLLAGTRYGLFRYANRSIVPVVREKAVTAIEPLQNGSGAALAVADGSLIHVGKTSAGTFGPSVLDDGPLSTCQLSPDRRVCVYQTVAGEVKAVFGPSAASRPVVLRRKTAWKPLIQPPRVIGIRSAGDSLVFVTTQGAFIYDPAAHDYKDLSQARWVQLVNDVQREEMRTLLRFDRAVDGEQYVPAIADGSPVVLDTNRPSRWECVDPEGRTSPRDICECQGRFYGLGPEGQIYAYRQPYCNAPGQFCRNASALLAEHPLEENSAPGDLAATGIEPRLSILHEGKICTYYVDDARWDESDLPPVHDDGTVVQLRLLTRGSLFLLDNGKIANQSGRLEFGDGSLAFRPDQATAIAPATGGDSLLVGGPLGQICKYTWTSGSWQQIRSATTQAGGHTASELQMTDCGTFARMSDGRIFHAAGNGPWQPLPGVTHWAAAAAAAPDGRGGNVWVALGAGISPIGALTDSARIAQIEPLYCTGEAMQDFVETAVFAWQADRSRVAFFTGATGSLGCYDARFDRWEAISTADRGDWIKASTLLRFMPATDELFILAAAGPGQCVLRVNTDFTAAKVADLPIGARDASIALSGRDLHVAFIHSDSTVLRIYREPFNGKMTEFRRGGAPAPAGFDPSDVVYAEPNGALVGLLNASGAYCTYDRCKGRWASLRAAREGGEVHGWIAHPHMQDTAILLKADRGGGVFTIKGTEADELHVEAPPEDIMSLVTWAAGWLDRRQLKPGALQQAVLGGPDSGVVLGARELQIARVKGRTACTLGSGADRRNVAFKPPSIADGEFGIERVVYAQADAGTILLVSDTGACVLYSFADAKWELRRRAVPGESLYGWIPGARGTGAVLLLKTGPRRTAALFTRCTRIISTVVLPVPVKDAAPALLELTSHLRELNLLDEVCNTIVLPGDRILLTARTLVARRSGNRTVCMASAGGTALVRPAVDAQVFRADQIVYGQHGDSFDLLVDGRGSCAVFSYETGCWAMLNAASAADKPEPTQALQGWLTLPGRNDALLLLEKRDSGTTVVPVQDGRFAEGHTFAAPAADAAALLGWLGRRSFQPAALRQAQLRVPCDGTLHQSDDLHIVRAGNRTAYRVKAEGIWLTLHALKARTQPCGFLEDTATSIALSPAANLWVLQRDEFGAREARMARLAAAAGTTAIGLTPDAIEAAPNCESLVTTVSGSVCLTAASGERFLLHESQPAVLTRQDRLPEIPLAGLAYADCTLQWSISPAGELEACWLRNGQRLDDLPVWHQQKLAVQCVTDIAMADADGLLQATKFGVLLRSAATFAPLKADTDVRDASFVRAYGPNRIIVKDATGRSFTWEKDGLVPLDKADLPARTSTVPVGPWQWQMLLWKNDPAGPPELAIAHVKDTRRLRRWPSREPYRFADDMVNWIARSPDEQTAWLATNDGLWPYTLAAGRAVDSNDLLPGETVHRAAFGSDGSGVWSPHSSGDWSWIAPPPGTPHTAQPQTLPAEAMLKNPAMTTTCCMGELQFHPFDGDGRPAIVNGRMFHDSAQAILSWQQQLYALLPGRCLMSRSPDKPAQITGCWALPADLPASAESRLTRSANSIRLELPVHASTDIVMWELRDDKWAARTVVPAQPEAAFSIFTWYRQPGGEIIPDILPSALVSVQGREPGVVGPWWSGDRFTWDIILSCGALDGTTAACISPLGIQFESIAQAGRSTITHLCPLEGLRWCSTAIELNKPVGLVTAGADDFPQYHISLADGGTVAPRDSGDSLRCLATIDVCYVPHPGRRFVGFRERHVPVNKCTDDDRQFRIQSTLPAVPTPLLVRDGQFVFDRWTGCCQTVGGRDAIWCSVNSTDNLLCTNSLDKSGLSLLGVWKTDDKILAARATPPGGILCLLKKPDGSGWVSEARLQDDAIAWAGMAAEDAFPAFRTGDTVRVEAPNLAWRAEPRYIWTDEPPCSASPAGYPLFASSGQGAALSFDVMTTLACDSNTNTIAIGSAGGVLMRRFDNDPRLLLPVSHPLVFNVGLDQPAVQAERVRFGPGSGLWCRFAGNRVMRLSGEPSWQSEPENWPSRKAVAAGRSILLTDNDLWANRKRFAASNDLLWWKRKPLTGIVDVFPCDHTQMLWLCTRDNGLFRILPRELP